jgi:hypothetical protein
MPNPSPEYRHRRLPRCADCGSRLPLGGDDCALCALIALLRDLEAIAAGESPCR